MKPSDPTPTQMAACTAVVDALRPFGEELTAIELLAVLSYTVGKCIALQDQRVTTPEMALQIVQANIEAGNAHIADKLRDAPGGHA